MSGIPTEAQFISYGLRKLGYPAESRELIQDYLDNPALLDEELDNPEYLEDFYKFYDWYWADKR